MKFLKKSNISISVLALTFSFMLLVMSVYAWFFESESLRDVFIRSALVDFEMELYTVEDANLDGIYDGDIDFEPFNVIHSKPAEVGEGLTAKDFVGIGNSNVVKEISSVVDEKKYHIFTDIDDLDTNRHISLSQIPNEKYSLNIYPSTVVTYALKITNKKPTVGRVVFKLDDVYEDEEIIIGALAEVVSLNVGENKAILYKDGDVFPKLLEVSTHDESFKDFLIEPDEVLWLFFSFKFETIDALRDEFQIPKFSDYYTHSHDLNDYSNLTEITLPTIIIEYEIVVEVES